MSRTTKRFLSILLAAAMILSLGITGWAIDDTIEFNPEIQAAIEAGKQADADNVGGTELELEKIDPSTLNVPKLGEIALEDEIVLDDEDLIDLGEIVRVSIVMDRPATLSAGYSTQNIAENKSAMSYRQSLRQQQASVEAAIASAGVSMNVMWNLTLVVNIISAEVRYGDIETIKEIPGVKDVWLENIYEPQEDNVNTVNTTEYMVGAKALWLEGYTGAGSRVAIIDTGTAQDHQSFSAEALEYALAKDGLTPDLLTWADISAVATQLNANTHKNSAGLTEDVYKNTKIPFAYNYVDGGYVTDHSSDSQGEHGSHVSGIAAANRYVKIDGEFVDAAENVWAVGVAPDAQILTMKVFGKNGGASDSDYMAAIEDAIVLKADSINLSLGSAAPGSTFSNGYQEIMDGLVECGSVVSISAGNSYNWAYAIPSGAGLLYAEDVNLDTVGSPGSFTNSLSVAAAENTGTIAAPMYFNEDQMVAFNEPSGNNAPFNTIAGNYGYVLLNGPGVISEDDGTITRDDFAAIGSEVLNGKIALCFRGASSFFEKANAAAAQGAAGVIIINNTAGTINMSLSGYTYTVPVASILQSDGNAILAASEKVTDANGNEYYTGSVEITAEVAPVVTTKLEDAYITDFSSWGVPGSLIMKPEITAPGGDIYSVNGMTNDGYEFMSGTSMAAPHITGMAALLGQFIRENNLEEITGQNRRTLINSLLMSTATPMIVSGAYLPVLQQGSGLGNTYAATQAKSYILMDEKATSGAADGKVKVELGQDAARTGAYSFSFTVNNFSDVEMVYELATDIFTQGLAYDGINFYQNTKTSYWGGAYSESYSFEHFKPNPHDVNKNGVTDEADAQAILDYLTGKVDGAELDLKAGDMDDDDVLSSFDAQLLLIWEDKTGANDLVVPAGASVPVTVSIVLSDDMKDELDNYFTNGTWIEGFTYVTPKTKTWDGEILGVEHSIPILGFYGSYTESSMFDCVDAISVAYGNAKTSYTGNAKTNYLTVNYGKGDSVFMGNPYAVEDKFPAERLSVSSTTQLVNFKYNLIRNSASGGWIALDAKGELLANGPWSGSSTAAYYHSNNRKWMNTTTSTAVIGTTAAKLGLKEGDEFSIYEFAIPEYYGMQLHPGQNVTRVTPDEVLDLIDSGELGSGASFGYTFVIDDTNPSISKATLSEDKNTITFTAKDDKYIAYLAIVDLNGQVKIGKVPEQTEPGTEVSVEFDISALGLEGAVAAFVGDYAGNEDAYLIRISGEGPVPVEVETTRSYYKPANRLSGNRDYLIVSANTEGEANAMATANNANVSSAGVAVNIVNGTVDKYTGLYIDGETIPDTIRWKSAAFSYGVQYGYTFQSVANAAYLCVEENAAPLAVSGADNASPWKYSRNQLNCVGIYTYTESGEAVDFYLTWTDDGFFCATTQPDTKIYLFERVEYTATETIEIDPENASSVTVYPDDLVLLEGETAQLKATVEPLVLPDKSVTWSSSDESIATVDENGLVTAVGSGVATITATSNVTPDVFGTATVTVPAGLDATVYAQVAFSDSDVQFVAIDMNDMSTTNLSGDEVFSYFYGGGQSGDFIYGNDTDNDFHSYNAETYEYDSFWHDIYEVIIGNYAMLDGAALPGFSYTLSDGTELVYDGANVTGVCPAGLMLFYSKNGLYESYYVDFGSYGFVAAAFAGYGKNDDGTIYYSYYTLSQTGALYVVYIDFVVNDGVIVPKFGGGGSLGMLEGLTMSDDSTAYSMAWTRAITGENGVLIADSTKGAIYYVTIDYSASPYLSKAELVGVVSGAANLSTMSDNYIDTLTNLGSFSLSDSGTAIDEFFAAADLRGVIPMSIESQPVQRIGDLVAEIISEPADDDIVIGDDDIIVVGGLNSIRDYQPIRRDGLLDAAVLINPDTFEDDGYVVIDITTPDATEEVDKFYNGFATLEYDPKALTFESLTPNAGLEITSYTVDEKAGLIKFAYASTDPVEAGAVATVKFTGPEKPTAVVATTLEANKDLDVGEETIIKLGEGFMLTIEDFTKLPAEHIVGIEDKGLYSGEVTFTVTSDGNDQAILVAVKTVAEDGSVTYTALPCTTEDGVHNFSITIDKDTAIVLVFRGDTDLDGKVDGKDGNMVSRYAVKKYDITDPLILLAVDIDRSGVVDGKDGNMISRSAVRKYVIPW